jgi:hypothetical protein
MSWQEQPAGLLLAIGMDGDPWRRSSRKTGRTGTGEGAREKMAIRSRLAQYLYLFVVVAGTAMVQTSASAQDVVAYCARVGNDDRVQPVPDRLIPAARRIFHVSAETSDTFVQASTSVRCMNGKTWLCNYGANLICEKADVSRDSYGAEKFCRANPDSIGVPMSATGHATIYEWACVGRQARIVRQAMEVDARGFIAENWQPLE